MFCSVVATNDTNRKVSRPVNATNVPTSEPAIAGDSRSSRKTPALTMVLEWSSAEVGDGAYMAPSSHDENGNWALLVIPARASSAMAGSSAAPAGPAVRRARSSPSGCAASSTIASENPRPPTRFMFKARNA